MLQAIEPRLKLASRSSETLCMAFSLQALIFIAGCNVELMRIECRCLWRPKRMVMF